MAYTKPQQWKKEESEMLRVERDQIKFIDLTFELNGMHQLPWTSLRS